jgi:DNA-binding XRE family transcriptional regulator
MMSCRLCGSQDQITVDHIIPITSGGKTTPENLQTLCRSCNSRKGGRGRRPVPPKATIVARVADPDAPVTIRELRERKGWTQRRLAQELGVSSQAVLYWESGQKTPTVPHLRALARALDTTMDAVELGRPTPIPEDR